MSAPSVLRRLATAVTVLVAVSVLGACTPDRDLPTEQPGATIAVVPRISTGEPPQAQVPTRTPIPTPSPTTTPRTTTAPPSAQPTPRPDEAAADRAPFEMNLAARADFVAQYTFEWCVGASLQMALNMATDKAHTTKADQQRLWEIARDLSSSPFGGANPRGWTAALNDLGIGPYRLVSLPTFDEALAVAAEAIRATKRPVGLVMWRGRHAWVMSGFESKGDPRRIDDAEITGIRVHDPLYPHGSSVWGKSPKPNSLVTPRTLARQYVIRDRGRVDLGVPPGFLLVLPVAATA